MIFRHAPSDLRPRRRYTSTGSPTNGELPRNMRPARTAFRSPWQNGIPERLGRSGAFANCSIHSVVLNEVTFGRLLGEVPLLLPIRTHRTTRLERDSRRVGLSSASPGSRRFFIVARRRPWAVCITGTTGLRKEEWAGVVFWAELPTNLFEGGSSNVPGFGSVLTTNSPVWELPKQAT